MEVRLHKQVLYDYIGRM